MALINGADAYVRWEANIPSYTPYFTFTSRFLPFYTNFISRIPTKSCHVGHECCNCHQEVILEMWIHCEPHPHRALMLSTEIGFVSNYAHVVEVIT